LDRTRGAVTVSLQFVELMLLAALSAASVKVMVETSPHSDCGCMVTAASG
jgi:hypothetical protein